MTGGGTSLQPVKVSRRYRIDTDARIAELPCWLAQPLTARPVSSTTR
ncbi:hypothetical protein AB0H34_39590 [Saccharopolyspora shandongensis]